jgi:phosphotransferase system HPr-like phosphotransfer protein
VEHKVIIESIEQAYSFYDIISTFSGEVDIKQDHYTINGKSLMGLFSLDLCKPITVVTGTADEEIAECVLAKFKVKGE